MCVKQSQMQLLGDDSGRFVVPMQSTRGRHHPYSHSTWTSLSGSTSSVPSHTRFSMQPSRTIILKYLCRASVNNQAVKRDVFKCFLSLTLAAPAVWSFLQKIRKWFTFQNYLPVLEDVVIRSFHFLSFSISICYAFISVAFFLLLVWYSGVLHYVILASFFTGLFVSLC